MKLNRKCFLIVDDVPAICSLLAEYFEGKGFEVWTANKASQARDLLAIRQFSVVITNLRLDWSDCSGGLEVAAFAKRESPKMPVVVMSGAVAADTMAQLTALGVDAFVAKPAPLHKLEGLVRELLIQPHPREPMIFL